MKKPDFFVQACLEISKNITNIPNNEKHLQAEIKKICKKYSLDRIPKKSDIIKIMNINYKEKDNYVLTKKPIRTASGVAIITVMPKPYACPHGRCTYCPGGIESNSPNSYTGNEIITKNAIRNKYEPKQQIIDKLKILQQYGHNTSKIELVIVGGTFLFMPKKYQENFIKSCYDALNGYNSPNLTVAKYHNEKAVARNVGFTLETKPEYCKKEHVDSMLTYGITRIELGVQNLQEKSYNITNRGHNISDVINSFHVSKDAGLKIVAHMMLGLPGATTESDTKDFIKLFVDQRFKPDMLKIYPTLILKNTKIYDEYKNGRYTPYTNTDIINIITKIKKNIPRWIRIMRIQREISPNEIIAGPKHGNLRQLVKNNLKKQGIICKCIRCREIGLRMPRNEIKLNREEYESSNGYEIFLSCDDAKDYLYGFLRLRIPSNKKYRKEITERCCIIRELHVYGKVVGIGKNNKNIQHSGLGKMLISEAEKIAREEFNMKKILVISAIGTKEYYKKLGYLPIGAYMGKKIT